MKNYKAVLVAVLALTFATFATAQVATGTPAYGSFTGGPDVINLGNLNAHLAIPVLSKPGRGIPFSYTLGYDSSIWGPTSSNGLSTWTPVANWGWVGQTQAQTGYVSYTTRIGSCTISDEPGHPLHHYTIYHFNAYNDKFGVSHVISADVYYYFCDDTLSNETATVSTSDGSGYTVDFTDTPSAVVHDRNGLLINAPVQKTAASGTVTDANGNQLSTNGSAFIDTLGTTALTIAGNGTPTSPVTYTYTDTSGTARSVTVNYANFTVQTAFGCSGIGEYNQANVSLITSIVYADSTTSYQFAYEATTPSPNPVTGGTDTRPTTGRIGRVTLPTGGTISYSYFNGSNGVVCSDGSTAAMHRTTTDGDTVYGRTQNSSTSWTTSITPPDNNLTSINFQTAGINFYETGRTNYSGSSTVVGSAQTCYNGAVPPNCNAAIVLPINRITVYPMLANGFKSETDTVLSGGLVTDVNEYDFGATVGTVGPLVRHTATTYTVPGGYLVRAASVSVTDVAGLLQAQTTFTYDGTALTATSGVVQHVAVSGARGNPTSVSRWLNSPTSTYLTTTNWYDDTGQLVQTEDPGAHYASFHYDDSWSACGGIANPSNTNAYLTMTVNHLGQQNRMTYYPCSGQLQSVKDQNDINASRSGTTQTYDSMLRPLVTTRPDSGQDSATYLSATATQVTSKIDSSNNSNAYVYLDGYSRTRQTRAVDPQGDVFTDVTYDDMGRVSTVSNPYRAGDTVYNTTMQYDALSRVTSVIKPDGSYTSDSYSGNSHTANDEAGKGRIFYSDALGRIYHVIEPKPDGTSWAYNTWYTYDALNNLLSVNQQGDGTGTARNRTFTYDSLSRLLTATNPESGAISYAYDADGNLGTRTDARNITTTYSYDALHRLWQRTYSNGATGQNWLYDSPDAGKPANVTVTNSIGRLVRESNNVNAAAYYSYDNLGRLINTYTYLPSYYCASGSGWCNVTTASYNLAGGITSLTYPSGRKVTQAYDSAGRLNNVTFDSFNGTAVNYNYWNVPASVGGTLGFNSNGVPRFELLANSAQQWQNVLDNRQRLSADALNSGGTVLWHNYTYLANSNVSSIVDNLNANKTQTFSYDYLNRITSAAETGSTGFGQTFTYDPWGNLSQQTPTKGTNMPSLSQAVNTANQFVGYCYDAVGNVTSFSTPCTSPTYFYDAENRQTNNTSGTSYTYDANGQRVRKSAGSNYTEYIYFGGQAIAEKNQAGDWSDYIFANGKRIAKADTFDYEVHLRVNNASATGQYVSVEPIVSSWPDLTIHSGDKLYFRQYQAGSGNGGVQMAFASGAWVAGNTGFNDAQGQPIDHDTTQGWHNRMVDLNSYAGQTLSRFILVEFSGSTGTGGWDVWFKNIAIVGTDGTVRSVYQDQPTVSWNGPYSSAVSTSAYMAHDTAIATDTDDTTAYYHGDHLGSARMMTSAGGWPVWQGTYLPFGYEYNAQASANHYKFTDDEQDPETGNSHTLFRDLSPIMGRWMSPDPYLGSMDIGNPQSMNRYAYVQNDPIDLFDPFGLDTCNFTVQLNNTAGLSASDINAIQQRVQDVFAAPAGKPGNSVGITFTSSNSADAKLNITNSGWFGNLFGLAFGSDPKLNIGNASVYADKIQTEHPGQGTNNFIGSVAAHELGHKLGHFLDNPFGWNIMTFDWLSASQMAHAIDNANFSIWKFSAKQTDTLYNQCKQAHQTPSGSNGGGGGGGYSSGQLGQWQFFAGSYAGEGAVFAGWWIWVPAPLPQIKHGY